MYFKEACRPSTTASIVWHCYLGFCISHKLPSISYGDGYSLEEKYSEDC